MTIGVLNAISDVGRFLLLCVLSVAVPLIFIHFAVRVGTKAYFGAKKEFEKKEAMSEVLAVDTKTE